MSGIENRRSADAANKAALRAKEKDLTIPDVVNRRRRNRCLKDPHLFLRTYFPQFNRPFTKQQNEIIESIIGTARHGGSLAIAASRGEGKTTIAQYLVGVYGVVSGMVRFPLICAATGPHAGRILGNIKRQYTRNQLLYDDFPEVCHPIWDVRLAPQRGPSQTVNGEPTFCQWAGDQVVMPTVKGSLASGAIIATTGLDAAIRGLMIDGSRPDFVLIDDPETRESAASEEQCEKRELLIEEDLSGLGGQDRPLAMVMLTTCMRRECLSAKYTDPKQKQSWRGRRFRLIEKWPERMDLWDDYCSQRQANQQTGDDNAREAHKFYLANRELMDAGAEVANKYRFKALKLDDGSKLEVSALQSCFNIIADRNRQHFDTEYQNDPPEESGPIESGITPHRIQRQVSGYERKIVPPGCTVITQGIDVRKVALHWTVRAWMANGTGYTIDYGIHEVLGTVYGSDDGLDVCIRRSILGRLEQSKEYDFNIDLTLIDAGWQTPAVYSACADAGQGVYPVMGFGKSAGCVQANFRDVYTRTKDRKPPPDANAGWFLSRKGKVWLVCADADQWKQWEHTRWMTAPGKPGRMEIFGAANVNPERLSDDEKGHHSYARHICNEIEIEEPHNGTIRRRWKAKSENTHWLDSSYYANVAANIKGVKVLSAETKRAEPKQKMTMAEMAARAAKARR